MAAFKKMRLIPDYMYEKMNQSSSPRSVDFGDETNAQLLDMTKDISSLMRDNSKPIEERVRLFYQHLLRKIANNSRTKISKDDADDKKRQDQEVADDDRNKRSIAAAVAKRNADIFGVHSKPGKKKTNKNRPSADDATDKPPLIGYEPFGGLFPSPEHKKLRKEKNLVPEKATPAAKSHRDVEESKAVRPATPPSPPSPPSDQEPVPSKDEDEHFSTADEGEEPAEGSDDASTWRRKQKADLEAGNRLSAQKRLKDLLASFFTLDNKTGEMRYRDDSKPIRGADFHKIINYFVPMKNIHPKVKPNGTAALIEILRVRDLYDSSLFPNQSLATLFQEYGDKPTAHQTRIRDQESLNKRIKSLAAELELTERQHEQASSPTPSPTGAAAAKNWSAFY